MLLSKNNVIKKLIQAFALVTRKYALTSLSEKGGLNGYTRNTSESYVSTAKI